MAIKTQTATFSYNLIGWLHLGQSQNEQEEKRNELIFDLVKKRFDSERERARDLDGKANNLIGFISIVVGLLLGGAGTFKFALPLPNLPLSILYFIGVGILLASIGFALAAFKIRNWIVVPNMRTLITKYVTAPYEEVLKRNAGEMAKAVINSEIQNDTKAKLIEWSWYLLISGLSMVFIFVFAYTMIGSHS